MTAKLHPRPETSARATQGILAWGPDQPQVPNLTKGPWGCHSTHQGLTFLRSNMGTNVTMTPGPSKVPRGQEVLWGVSDTEQELINAA